MESGRGGDALRAARAAARAAREDARAAAEQAHRDQFPPEPEPEPTPEPLSEPLSEPDDVRTDPEPRPREPGAAPLWYPPLVGAWAAAVAAVTAADATAVRLAGVLGLLAALGGFSWWFRGHRTAPSAPLPDAFRPAAVGYAAAALGAAVVAWLVARSNPAAGAAVAFVLMTAVVLAYERAYAAATRP